MASCNNRKPDALRPVYTIEFGTSDVTISTGGNASRSWRIVLIALAWGIAFAIAAWIAVVRVLNIEASREVEASILLASLAVFLSIVIVLTLARRKTYERIALAVISSQKEIEAERLRYSALERDKRIARLLETLEELAESEAKHGGADEPRYRMKPEGTRSSRRVTEAQSD